MKKKILFVITHMELGGAQKQLLCLIKNLDREKYSLYLCSGDNGRLKDEFLDIAYLKVNLIPELVRAINPLYDLISFIKLYLYIRGNDFDIIHTHSPKASMLGRWAAFLAGSKNIIYTVHGWPFHEFMNPALRKAYIFLERLTALITKKIILVSSADFDKGVKNRVSSADKFAIIHYGIDLNRAGAIFAKRQNKRSFDKNVLNISCLKPQKGLSYFLKAVRLISESRQDITFYIAGDGPLRKEIEEKIKSCGLRKELTLKGWVDDISHEFLRASVLVITSLWEGLPLAVIEAVLSGVPVAATDTGGLRDILSNNRNGIIVNRKDIKAVVSAVLDIIDNPRKWRENIIEERQKINTGYWSEKRMTAQTEELYREVFS